MTHDHCWDTHHRICISFKYRRLCCFMLNFQAPWGPSEKWNSFSCVQLFAIPWTVVHQTLPSMRFPRQEYWSGLPFPSPGDLSNPVIKPGSLATESDSLSSEPPGKLGFTYPPNYLSTYLSIYKMLASIYICIYIDIDISRYICIIYLSIFIYIYILPPWVLPPSVTLLPLSSEAPRLSKCHFPQDCNFCF